MDRNKINKEQFTLFLHEKESVFVSSAKEKRKEKKGSDTWFYLGFVGEIGFAIAIPIAGGAIIGSLVGHRILGLGLGILISLFGFVKTIQEIIKRK